MKLASLPFCFSFFIMGTAALVRAEPIYLRCHLFSSSGFATKTPGVIKNEILYNIALDEANQQVSYSLVDTGYTQKATGIFYADKVFFVSHVSSFDFNFAIDRVDLSFQRNEEKGYCSLVETPKNRKF